MSAGMYKSLMVYSRSCLYTLNIVSTSITERSGERKISFHEKIFHRKSAAVKSILGYFFIIYALTIFYSRVKFRQVLVLFLFSTLQ